MDPPKHPNQPEQKQVEFSINATNMNSSLDRNLQVLLDSFRGIIESSSVPLSESKVSNDSSTTISDNVIDILQGEDKLFKLELFGNNMVQAAQNLSDLITVIRTRSTIYNYDEIDTERMEFKQRYLKGKSLYSNSIKDLISDLEKLLDPMERFLGEYPPRSLFIKQV